MAFQKDSEGPAANRGRSARKRRRPLFIALAACVALAAVAAVLLPWLARRNGTAAVDPGETDLYVIPTWEERELPDRYDTAEIGGRRYGSLMIKAEPAEVGGYLCETVLTGYDRADINFYIAPEKAKSDQIGAEVYAVKAYDSKYVVAIRFEGKGDYYVYQTDDEAAQTLGELIDRLDLRQNLVFDALVTTYRENDREITMEVPLPERSELWTLLTSAPQARYEQLDALTHPAGGSQNRRLQLRCSLTTVSRPRGQDDLYDGYYFDVSEDGYLFSNVFQTGAYFIGGERARAFIEEVLSGGGGTVINEIELPPNASRPEASSVSSGTNRKQ